MNIDPSAPIDHTDITQGSDLSGMDLTGVDLTSADLSEAYLSNVILAGADLSNADLSGADLTDTTLAGADLSNATLTGADLSNAGLSGADLSDADLINTDLTDATLRGVDLSNATFAGADLTGADLTGTDLSQGKSADQKKSDELLTILQSLYDQLDRVPKSAEFPENSKYSPHDFYTEFGSWDEALKAAGIDKKQALLEDLNQVAEEVGHVPKTSDVDKHGTYSYSMYSSYFDSWDEALQHSGIRERFETESRGSSKEMINTLQSLYNQLDRVPKPTELPEKCLRRDFYTEFGSWDKALKAAGIDKEQAILDEIERVAEELGEIPTTGDIHNYAEYPASNYNSHFDSWDEALERSGVKERFETESRESSEEMINTLQSLHNELDRVPKSTELPENSKYSPNDFYTEFGSWDEALEAAGIDVEQAILDGIERVAKKLGHIPTTTDIHKHDAYPASNYTSCFDSWDEALQQSGVKERFETKSRESSEESREEMINTVQSLYDQLDRVPKSTELPENSKYSPSDFYTEFGGWDEALKAAGIDKEQAILDGIERVAEELGEIPTTGDIDNYAEYPASNYQSHFDSWDEALEQSGVKERFETKSRESSEESREEMINTLQSLYNQLDRAPKSTELPEKYSPHDFYTEFGSWDEALKAAGIDRKQTLLEDLNQVAEEVGHVPKTSDVNKHGTYSSSVYSSYFDSWDEALQHSGIRERFETESRGSSKEMINTLQSLYNQLDRVPKSTELPEKYSPRDFYTEFGSWDEALEAAGIDKEQAILDEIERVAEELGEIPTTGDIHNYAEYPASNYQSHFDSWDEALRESGVKEMFETKSKKSSDPIESDGESSSSPDGIERLLEIRGVGRPTARRILEAFGTVDEATSAPTHELTEIRGVGPGIAARITSKTGRQTGPDHDQPTTTAKSETSPENKNNDSIEILDEIANEFEEL